MNRTKKTMKDTTILIALNNNNHLPSWLIMLIVIITLMILAYVFFFLISKGGKMYKSQKLDIQKDVNELLKLMSLGKLDFTEEDAEKALSEKYPALSRPLINKLISEEIQTATEPGGYMIFHTIHGKRVYTQKKTVSGEKSSEKGSGTISHLI